MFMFNGMTHYGYIMYTGYHNISPQGSSRSITSITANSVPIYYFLIREHLSQRFDFHSRIDLKLLLPLTWSVGYSRRESIVVKEPLKLNIRYTNIFISIIYVESTNDQMVKINCFSRIRTIDLLYLKNSFHICIVFIAFFKPIIFVKLKSNKTKKNTW